MNRIVPLIAALALAAPGAAATYSARPATAPTAKRIVAKDVVWSCAAESCSGRTDSSRPVVLCQALARQAGRIEAFAANGVALASEELAKCNSAAKAPTGPALAKAE